MYIGAMGEEDLLSASTQRRLAWSPLMFILDSSQAFFAASTS